jgi:excisionase family DNA binding protein
MSDSSDPFCLLNYTMAHARPSADVTGPAAAIDRTREAASPAEGPPVFHTVEEVARALGVSPKTIQRRIRDGVIRKVAMGGRLVRISSSEQQRLAAERPLRPAAPRDEVSMS